MLLIAEIQKQAAFKPYRTGQYDTLKIYFKAHGAKTQNLVINFDRDDWVLRDDKKTLQEVGCGMYLERSLLTI